MDHAWYSMADPTRPTKVSFHIPQEQDNGIFHTQNIIFVQSRR